MKYFVFYHSSLLVFRHWANEQCPGSQLTLVTLLANNTQNLRENYSKSTKIAIAACKFFRASMPPDPQEPFLFLNQLQISSARKEIRFKKVWKLWKLLKLLATPLTPLCCAAETP